MHVFLLSLIIIIIIIIIIIKEYLSCNHFRKKSLFGRHITLDLETRRMC